MPGRGGLFRAVCLAVAVALAPGLAPAPAQAQGTEISVSDARRLGVALLAEGRYSDAATIAAALTARNENDTEAWLILARARRLAGDAAGARQAAIGANRSASSDAARYAASMELAAANFALDRRLRAQFWLRRAAQVAPTPALRAQAIRNFRQVEARTPWALTFEFSAVPSSNVNNGSRQETILIAGLPFTLSGDAQALSGVEFSAGFDARYRFFGLGERPAQFRIGVNVQRVTLSDEAKAQAPTAKGSDYAFDALEFGLTQVLSGRDAPVTLRFDGLIGANWYGGDLLTTYARAGLGTQWQTGEGRVAAFTASVERQIRDDISERSAWIVRADARHVWQVGQDGAFSLSGGVRHTNSASAEIDHKAANVGASYRVPGRVFDAATLEFGVTYERRDYAISPYSSDGRQDDRMRAVATLGFPNVSYFGFAPTVTFEGLRVKSNVSLYDSEDYGIRLGVQSVF